MKTGKEIKMITFKNYNVIFGSVNNKHPKALYIDISAWAEPQYDAEINYNRVIKDLNKKIKQLLFNLFDSNTNTYFSKNKSIIDLDIRESGIRYGKRSFINCEITLFLNTEMPVNSEEMNIILTNITNTVINKTFDDNKIFKFYKRKS
jgi:hypothetical protein